MLSMDPPCGERRRESELCCEACEKVLGVAIDSGGRARLVVQSAVRDAAVCEFGEVHAPALPLASPAAPGRAAALSGSQ